MPSEMFVENFEAYVSLGCSKEEQSFPQPVHISVRLLFSKTIAGEQTDQLQDAIDYVAICDVLNRTATQKSYQLIESMAFECMEALTPLLNHYSGQLNVTVKKLRVPVKQLQGGVSWTCQKLF